MRIRTIKPEFWTDKRVASWDTFTRLFFVGLWSAADDHGRGSAEPERLAAELFPYDLSRDSRETLANVSRALASLSEASRIVVYKVAGEVFFQVINWTKHQKIDKPGKSRIPECSEENGATFATPSRDSRDTLATGTGNREQGTGTLEQGTGGAFALSPDGEQQPKAKREKFTPPTPEEAKLHAEKIGLPSWEVDKFLGYYESNGWRVGKNPMKNWQAAMVNWRGNWEGKGKPSASQPSRHQSASDYRNSLMVVDESLITEKDRQYMELAKRLEQ